MAPHLPATCQQPMGSSAFGSGSCHYREGRGDLSKERGVQPARPGERETATAPGGNAKASLSKERHKEIDSSGGGVQLLKPRIDDVPHVR